MPALDKAFPPLAKVASLAEAAARAFVASLAAQSLRVGLLVPVLLGIGISAYFTCPFETPGAYLALPIVVVAVALAVRFRGRTKLRRLNLAVAFLALGFFVADARSERVAAPVLAKEVWGVAFEGHIVELKAREERIRVVLDNLTLEGLPAEASAPERIRLSVRTDETLRPGDFIRGRASLFPPFEPSLPGDPDLARRDWFDRIGAGGFSLGRVERFDPNPAGTPGTPDRASPKQAWSLFWQKRRAGVVERLYKHLPNPEAGLAAALLAGARDRLPAPETEAMRAAGLAHLLAVSGLHVGLVAGTVYLLIRFLLACVPRIVLRHPIHKWAVCVALGFGFVYLFLAGATLPTQRAFAMLAFLTVAMLLNRRALSLYSVAWAATLILLFTPESLFSISFQLSFASVAALIAVWEALRRWRRKTLDEIPALAVVKLFEAPPARRLARKARLYFGGILLTTLTASLAVLPFGLYHFGRGATFGILSNLVGIPITAFWLVPLGLVSVLLMPLGLEGPALWLLKPGLTLVLELSRTVSGWPLAEVALVSGPAWSLVPLTLGGLWLVLLRGRVRLFGVIGICVFVVAWVNPPRPFLFASWDGEAFAVVAEHPVSGAEVLYSNQPESWLAEVWAGRLGEIPVRGLPKARQGPRGASQLACDDAACVFDAGEMRLSIVANAERLGEECARADLILLPNYWSYGALCRGTSARVVGREALRNRGGLVLHRSASGDSFTAETRCETHRARPWRQLRCER